MKALRKDNNYTTKGMLMENKSNNTQLKEFLSFILFSVFIYSTIQVYFILNAPERYTPPKYDQLIVTKGFVVKDELKRKKIKTLYTGNPPALNILHDGMVDYYSCHAFNGGLCEIGERKKYLSIDVYGFPIEVKWAKYMNIKLVYEIKINEKIERNYMESIKIYENGVKREIDDIKNVKSNLIRATFLFVIMFFLRIKI